PGGRWRGQGGGHRHAPVRARDGTGVHRHQPVGLVAGLRMGGDDDQRLPWRPAEIGWSARGRGEFLVRQPGLRHRHLCRAEPGQARIAVAGGRRVSGVKDSAGNAAAGTGWNGIFRGEYLFRILVLASAVALHAVNLYLSTTLLPAVVADIGGMPYYAWNTSLFVVASVLGAVMAAPILEKHRPRAACIRAAVVFAAGSALCALAPSMAVMLCGRVLQGLGGGLLLALPYALVRSVFPPPLWPRVMALFSGMWGVATVLGPLLGGLHAGAGLWRLAFWMVVLGAAAFAAGAGLALPRATRAPMAIPSLPWRQLVLLLCAVLVASVAGVLPFPWSVPCLGLAAMLAWALVRTESSASRR